jgi:tRNA G18 (ribose-2'-O)-methylase SpoU
VKSERAAKGAMLDSGQAAVMKSGDMRPEIDLELLSKLKEKNLAALGLIVLEGRIVIEKALEAGVVPRLLVCTEAEEEYWQEKSRNRTVVQGSAAPQTRTPAQNSSKPQTGASSFPVRVMNHEALCAFVDFKFHRGAIAIAEMPRIRRFEAAQNELSASQASMLSMARLPRPDDSVARTIYERSREAFLCLWDITDPSNLGALIRTAAGLGASGILLGPGCANPYYRKAIRASMGNAFSVPLWSADLALLDTLRLGGAEIVGATLSEQAVSLDVWAAQQGGFLILILGNEGYGLPQEVLSRCTSEVSIPMARGVDSLNVAVAGGILMYELFGKIRGTEKESQQKALKKVPKLGINGDRYPDSVDLIREDREQ